MDLTKKQYEYLMANSTYSYFLYVTAEKEAACGEVYTVVTAVFYLN